MTRALKNRRQTVPIHLACPAIRGKILGMSSFYFTKILGMSSFLFTVPALVVLIVIYVVLKKKGKA